MKKLTPYLLTCLTVVCFLLMPSRARASHAAGAEIIYEHISDSTYRVFFKFYRDCTGIPSSSSYTLCYKNSCNPTDIRDTVMNQWPGLIPPGVNNGTSVALGCSNASTTCDPNPTGTVMPGYEEWWYYAIIRLPYQCNFWTFSVAVSARNSSNNLLTPGLLYVETTFNNAYAQGNTSPYFSNKPIPYCCINTPYTYNNGAVDPDGDSLVTEVVNPLTSSGSCSAAPTPEPLKNPQTPYPNISFPNNPLQSNNTFVLNPLTGNMSFTPPVAGPYALSVRTKEYRNGVLIGTIMRDVQVQVISPCSVVAPAPPNPKNSIGGNIVNGQVQGCIGQPLNFCFDITSADTGAVLICSDNVGLSLGGNATTTYTNQKSDSVRGCVSWVPHKTGLYNLTVTVKDSTCRPPGILITNIYVVPVFIWGKTKASADTTVCPGDPVQLNVTGGGSYTWSYLSGPNGSLNTTSGPNPIAGPYATTEYVVTSNINPWCGDNAKDTVKVTVEQAITFTSIDNKIVCPGKEIQLDLQVVKEPGVTYTYKWTPNSGLTPSNVENPTVKPTGDITYRVEISASNNTCKAYDTVAIDVLDGITLKTPDTAICLGEKVKVNAKGDSRYAFSWDSPGNPSYNVAPIDSANAEITPLGLGTYTYTLKGEYFVNNVKMCDDTTVSFDIEVQPYPTVELPADATICYGDTMKIYATVNPLSYTKYTYTWSPGQALDDPNSKDPIFSAYATTTLKMVASSSAGCKDDEELTLTVLPSDFMTVSNDTAICPNDTAQLHMVGVGLKSFYWSVDNNISSKTNTDPFVWPAGTQIYHVYGRDTNQCYDTQSVRVTVKPAAILDLPDSVRIYPGESYQMDPQGNGSYFSWFPHVGLSYANISNPVAKPDVNTRYTVTAITEFGCKATTAIDVLVSPDSYIDMPNAFIPGNGVNGTFKAVKLGDAKLKSFAIYNRWGLKVFETSDIAQGWDGRYNGEAQPMGVYVYTIEAITPAGRKFTKQGNITLIR